MFGIARNVLLAANHRAQVYGQRYLVSDAAELDVFAHGHRALWVQEDGGPEIADAEFFDALMSLPAACQAAFLRHRRDGWSYEQIAHELGVSKRVKAGSRTILFRLSITSDFTFLIALRTRGRTNDRPDKF